MPTVNITNSNFHQIFGGSVHKYNTTRTTYKFIEDIVLNTVTKIYLRNGSHLEGNGHTINFMGNNAANFIYISFTSSERIFNNSVISGLRFENGYINNAGTSTSIIAERSRFFSLEKCSQSLTLNEGTSGFVSGNCKNFTISTCISNSNLNKKYTRGFVGDYCDRFNIYKCAQTGSVIGDHSAGIVGRYSNNPDSITININDCYILGKQIYGSARGILYTNNQIFRVWNVILYGDFILSPLFLVTENKRFVPENYFGIYLKNIYMSQNTFNAFNRNNINYSLSHKTGVTFYKKSVTELFNSTIPSSDFMKFPLYKSYPVLNSIYNSDPDVGGTGRPYDVTPTTIPEYCGDEIASNYVSFQYPFQPNDSMCEYVYNIDNNEQANKYLKNFTFKSGSIININNDVTLTISAVDSPSILGSSTIVNGNNHSISVNLGSSAKYVGLFKATITSDIFSDGIIDAVRVSDINLLCTRIDTYNNFDELIGGGGIITGQSSGFIIENCSVNKLYSNGYIYTNSGGIAGAGCTNYKISKCYSNLDINSNSGGIVGPDSCSTGKAIIEKCHNSGNMSNNCGGIIGPNACSGGMLEISQCFNTGNADYYFHTGIGGIAGGICCLNGGKIIISECFSTGTIGDNQCGGIISKYGGNSIDGWNCIIKSCHTSCGVYNNGNSGGIIYSNEGSNSKCLILSCYNQSQVDSSITGVLNQARCVVENCYTNVNNNKPGNTVLTLTDNKIYGNFTTTQMIPVTENLNINSEITNTSITSDEVSVEPNLFIPDSIDYPVLKNLLYNDGYKVSSITPPYTDSRYYNRVIPVINNSDENVTVVDVSQNNINDVFTDNGFNDWNTFYNHANYTVLKYKLQENVILNDNAFLNLRDYDVFDGNGFTIKREATTDITLDGIFKGDCQYVNRNCIITNLGIENSNITNSHGAFIRPNSNGFTLMNSFAKVTANVTNVGGLVGTQCSSIDGDHCKVSNCFSIITLKQSCNGGGIVSTLCGINGGKIAIERCYGVIKYDFDNQPIDNLKFGGIAGGYFGSQFGGSTGIGIITSCYTNHPFLIASSGAASTIQAKIFLYKNFSGLQRSTNPNDEVRYIVEDVIDSSSGQPYINENSGSSQYSLFSNTAICGYNSINKLDESTINAEYILPITFTHKIDNVDTDILIKFGETTKNIGSVFVNDDKYPIKQPLLSYFKSNSESVFSDKSPYGEQNNADTFIYGCTNSIAENYDASANIDDGSCENIQINSSNVNDFFKVDGTGFSAKTYKLVENISLNSDLFMKMSAGAIFDGNGFTINMNTSTFAGLFSYDNTADSSMNAFTIKNLGVLGGTILSNGGAIIRSRTPFFKVDNCYSTSIIGYRAGGIAGEFSGSELNPLPDGFGSGGYCEITNCYSTGAMNGSSSGGIVGYRAGYKGICIIENSYSKGEIAGNTGGGIAGSYAGWDGECRIKNCYSTGTISANDSGGIAGSYAGYAGNCMIENCYSSGDLISHYSGGIVGTGAASNSGFCNIINCFSIGQQSNVTSETTYCGGIAGYGCSGDNTNRGNGTCNITNCYSTSSNIGFGGGGIVSAYSGYYGTCNISNCYSSALERNDTTINGYIGGYRSNCTIINCFSRLDGGSSGQDGNYDIALIQNGKVDLNLSTNNEYVNDVIEPKLYPLLSVFLDESNFPISPYGLQNNYNLETYVLGCTDQTSINYNPLANFDDNSCDGVKLLYTKQDGVEINIKNNSNLPKYFKRIDENNYRVIYSDTNDWYYDLSGTPYVNPTNLLIDYSSSRVSLERYVKNSNGYSYYLTNKRDARVEALNEWFSYYNTYNPEIRKFRNYCLSEDEKTLAVVVEDNKDYITPGISNIIRIKFFNIEDTTFEYNKDSDIILRDFIENDIFESYYINQIALSYNGDFLICNKSVGNDYQVAIFKRDNRNKYNLYGNVIDFGQSDINTNTIISKPDIYVTNNRFIISKYVGNNINHIEVYNYNNGIWEQYGDSIIVNNGYNFDVNTKLDKIAVTFNEQCHVYKDNGVNFVKQQEIDIYVDNNIGLGIFGLDDNYLNILKKIESDYVIESYSLQKHGCSDINATNYDSRATINDGTCTYEFTEINTSKTNFEVATEVANMHETVVTLVGASPDNSLELIQEIPQNNIPLLFPILSAQNTTIDVQQQQYSEVLNNVVYTQSSLNNIVNDPSLVQVTNLILSLKGIYKNDSFNFPTKQQKNAALFDTLNIEAFKSTSLLLNNKVYANDDNLKNTIKGLYNISDEQLESKFLSSVIVTRDLDDIEAISIDSDEIISIEMEFNREVPIAINNEVIRIKTVSIENSDDVVAVYNNEEYQIGESIITPSGGLLIVEGIGSIVLSQGMTLVKRDASYSEFLVINDISTNEDVNVTSYDILKDVSLGYLYEGESLIVEVSGNTTAAIDTVDVSNNLLNISLKENANGSDTITLKLKSSMNSNDSIEKVVTITVKPVNDAPTAEDKDISLNDNVTTEIILSGSDVETSNLTYSIVSPPTKGSYELSGNIVYYTPNNLGADTDSFTYKVNDGTIDSNIATVNITIIETNVPPTISPISDISMNEGETKNVTFTTSDGNGDALTVTVTNTNTSGNIESVSESVSESGNTITIVAKAEVLTTSTETITVTVNDGKADPVTETFTVTINAENDPPIAYDLSFTIQEDNMGTFELSANDVDNADLSYILVSDVSHGAVSIVGKVATYQPYENYSGTDSFTYKVNDGTVDSNIATVNITINAMNDPPTIETISDAIISEGETVNIPVTINDVEGDYEVTVSQSPNVLESLEYVDNEEGSRVIVTAKPQYVETVTTTVTVRVRDGHHIVDASFSVTVNAVNDPQTVMLLNGVNRVNEGETLKIRYTVIDEDLLVANGSYTLNVLQGVSEPYALVSTETISGNAGSKYLTGSVEIAIPRTTGDRTETYTIEIRDGANVASASRTVTVNAVRGCMNSLAANYNALATEDDGSCFVLGYYSTTGTLRIEYRR